MRDFVRLTGICLSLLLAVAANAQTLTTADTGHFSGPGRAARLVTGAKKEGALTLYSSAPVDVMSAVTAAFTKKYGVRVELWRAGSEQILQQIGRAHV